MQVLLIHQAFVSPDEPGGTRHYEMARRCTEQGVRFTIVASDLSYLTGKSTVAHTGLIGEQEIGGVRVLRAYTYPSLHRSFGWRVVSFLSFMLSSVVAAFKAGKTDLVMGTSPQIFQAVSAWFVAAVRRRPFLLEIRDLWPEFAIDMGLLSNPILIRSSRLLERFLYSRATHLLVNSPAYRDYLKTKGVPEQKISLIPNGVDPDMFDPNATSERVRRDFGLEGKFVTTYAGAFGLANDLATIVRTAARLRDQPKIHFLLVGDGKERANLESMARELQLTNLTLAPSSPKSEVPGILAASDACVATLKNIPMFITTYPNKVFDYMAAGRPTILAIDGVIRQVIEKAGGGLFVPPGDDAALASAVIELSNDRDRARQMGSAAREYVVKHFNRNQQANEFVVLAKRLALGPGSRMSFYRRVGKRVIDLAFAVPALVLLFPVILLVALAVRIKLGGPVLFRQERPGLNGSPFTLLKFRTMSNASGKHGELLPDAERLGSFGRFLRATSLDELPELFNVLKGEMSLIGPRPLLMEYLKLYTSEQMRRHEVRPGITGWAQVNGRNTMSWEHKFELDVWYVNHCSLWMDSKIAFLTLWKVLLREGISQEGHATMSNFIGTPETGNEKTSRARYGSG
ncbi:MAG TPA: sugar transferase [Blastocatellia bacterium]|nr:sugar transferase [Blastocatellia bacterium]